MKQVSIPRSRFNKQSDGINKGFNFSELYSLITIVRHNNRVMAFLIPWHQREAAEDSGEMAAVKEEIEADSTKEENVEDGR